MRMLILLVLLLCVMTVTQAQDNPPIVLNENNLGQTVTVQTGAVIEVRLMFSELYASYDPAMLQLLNHTPPANLSIGTVGSGVVYPETGAQSSGTTDTAPMPMPVEILPSEIQPLPPEPGQTGGGEQGVPGVVSGSAGTGIGYAEPVVVTGDPNPEDYVSTWTFLALAPGETTLVLRSFYPPCPQDQPCPMMPEFWASYQLVIAGEPIVLEPSTVEGETIVITLDDHEQTINVQPGQIIMIDWLEATTPYHLIYNPVALTPYITDDNLSHHRFLVQPFGMITRFGVQSADGTLFAVNLAIEALCDSCGVREGN